MEEHNQQLVPGAVVETNDGRLGIVDRVENSEANGSPAGVYVWLGQRDQPTLVPFNEIKAARSMDEVNRLATHLLPADEVSNVDSEGGALTGSEGEIRIPLAAERLRIDKRVVDLGELRIHKRVETVEEVQRVSVTHDELTIEHVPMNDQPLDAPLEPRIDNGQLIIPVMKEVLVISRQLVLVEEVRVGKRYVSEEHEVREPLRQERVEVEDATLHQPAEQSQMAEAETATGGLPTSQPAETNDIAAR